MGLHQCRKRGLRKVHWEFGYGVVERGLGKIGWAGLGVCEFILGFKIRVVKLSNCVKNCVCGSVI